MLEQMGKQAKDAAFILAQLNTTEKNHALSIIADQLEQQAERILAANQKDIEIAKQNGLSEALIDRLLLTEDRLKALRMMCAMLFHSPIQWGKLLMVAP